MKKSTISIFILCALSLFISCGDEKKSSAKKANETNSTKAKENKVETITSVVLYDGTPFYSENADGKMVYADEAPLGETIRIYVKNNSIEQKEAIRLLSSGKEETFNFVHVAYFDKDYWTRDIFITNDAALTAGCITAQALTYSSPDGSSATSKKIEAGTLVAVNESSKTRDTDLDIEFVEITYYSGAAFGKRIYVKSDLVSTNSADIVALQTIAKMKSNENLNPDVKTQLIDSLNSLPVSSYVADIISDL